MKPEIDPIRSASRQIVRELNLLDGNLCIEGFTFSECHLLTELEQLGQATASELGELLVLEKSTMSRLVNGLVEGGFVASSKDPADGRRRQLSLTKKGRRGIGRIHAFSNRQVDEALEFITHPDRQRVVEGMERYARALRYSRISKEFHIRAMRRRDNPAVAKIIRQVMTEYGAVGHGYSIQDAEVDAMFEAYPSPGSAFFVIERQGKVLGCGGMGPLAGGEPEVCELRKMYLLPDLRGSGLGTRLLTTILDAARSAGYSTCYLETLEHMNHARQLYGKYGFRPIKKALGHTGHSACNQFMTLAL